MMMMTMMTVYAGQTYDDHTV